jgi:hypothetical protein
MSLFAIDPAYNWKQAAAQEAVDYDAVAQAFMDQAYGVVANKAKVLFRDPFRLGFEIVKRNEKATKMVGVFAFRINNAVDYVPVFFVNGEVKPADMLYRGDVKRFIGLTEDWCAYRVRGVTEKPGELVDRNRPRQADAYLDRLAYPQRVKYASDENDIPAPDEIAYELFKHAADDSNPPALLLPELVKEFGPDMLEKLAGWIENSEIAQTFVAETYTEKDFSDASGWLAKQASEQEDHGHIEVILSPGLSKSASEHAEVCKSGYALRDTRSEDALNRVVEEIGDDTVTELKGGCVAEVLLMGGKMEKALVLREQTESYRYEPIAHFQEPCRNRPAGVYIPSCKQFIIVSQEVFGDVMPLGDPHEFSVSGAELKPGRHYLRVMDGVACENYPQIFRVDSKEKSKGVTTYHTTLGPSRETPSHGIVKLVYAPGKSEESRDKVSDRSRFLEIKVDTSDAAKKAWNFESAQPCKLMDGAAMERWFRTAGGVTRSTDVVVRPKPGDVFDLMHKEAGFHSLQVRDASRFQALLWLAQNMHLHVEKAASLLDSVGQEQKTFRVYETMSKSGYMTTVEGMENWIESFDPELQVKLDAPQKQILSTFTPQRSRQQARYGDTHQRGMDGRNPRNTFEDKEGLPMDIILSKSPEELAGMSKAYGMPHIFDHGCVGQLAESSFNVAEQIRQYIPDLEAGVDRLYRVLFLLRFRPADFEELYGKDALIAMEQDIAELASSYSETLLRLLKRFDQQQYSPQDN